MADIELLIKIPEELYEAYKGRPPMLGDAGMDMMAQSIANGTPLPKGHDRLIEANSVNQIVRPIEASDVKWGMTAETAIRLIHDAFEKAPTIIEADKEDEE